MKRIKSGISKFFKNIKHLCHRIVKEHLIREYIKKHKLFCTYVLTCIINSTLLRFFCMHTLENYLSIKPIIADLTIIVLAGSVCYLFKPKNRFAYLLFVEILFTAICMINSMYYTFYTSFASVSMLSLTQYIGEVGDAVVENVIQIKDLVYLLGPIALIAVHIRLKKINYYKKVESKAKRKKRTLRTLSASGILALMFLLTLTSLDVTRLIKQWNREYIVMKFGIYIYQANDVVTSIQPKINSLFGYDQAKKKFNDYFKDVQKPAANEYTNIFAGKNVIVIHGESMQTNTIGLKFNGKELMPNLTKMAHEGMYFSNFHSQVSVGTSSDTELTFNTSLMPTQSGTAFVSYSDREYIGIPKLLNQKGYYCYSMHANNADFWNRRAMHESLGYNKFYAKADYNVTKENTIGLGLNDREFFKQSIPKMQKVAKKHDKWYSISIMLTNHTPFSEVDKYGEFDLTLKEGDKTYPYMEGTKLGNYFKSAHYADGALGEFLDELDKAGLLENTVVVLYGDHDGRLPRKDYNRMHNYDKVNDKTLDPEDPNYKEYDSYQYELGRKVPFIIWTKDMKGTKLNKEHKNVMGMYDVMPTLGNMFGFYNKYALGHDIFTIKNNNIVVFPNGNWVTNKVYYDSQKGEYLSLNGEAISQKEIEKNNDYATKLLDVSNETIVFNLLKNTKEEKVK